MYDSTYGSMDWSGFNAGVSDALNSYDAAVHDAGGVDNYYGLEARVANNPWSDAAIQRDALTAGNHIPATPYTYPTTGDYIKWWGDATGVVVGKTIGGPTGGVVGNGISGAGHALGDYYDSKDSSHHGTPRD
jgi:hypothetical protein